MVQSLRMRNVFNEGFITAAKKQGYIIFQVVDGNCEAPRRPQWGRSNDADPRSTALQAITVRRVPATAVCIRFGEAFYRLSSVRERPLADAPN